MAAFITINPFKLRASDWTIKKTKKLSTKTVDNSVCNYLLVNISGEDSVVNTVNAASKSMLIKNRKKTPIMT